MDFPHLRNDTAYPYMNNVDVYSFINNFDYTRWSEKTRVKLVNVIWNSDYKDVVDFETDEARDKYFDSIDDSFSIELRQAARIVPDGMIKLPIPYDVLARYNYLYIDMPIATSEDAPIDWETKNGIKRWYFFIDSLYYRAPNTTEARLLVDVWTNFHNDVEINYMMLERGHAPVAYTKVDDYLANPLQHNKYLLAPDVNYGETSIVKNAEYIPFGDGEKYMVFISTVKPSDLSSIGHVTNSSSDSWSNPTYSDINARYGYQLQVNGYNFGDAGDYSNLNTPVANGESDILPNNVTAYAVKASSCYGSLNFIETMRAQNPNFMQTILAAFVVSSEMITLGTRHTFLNFYLYECTGVNKTVGNITLTKGMFNFPKEIAKFAKLYTFPYSYLELTDNDGRKVNIKIEETGNIQCNFISSLAYPFLNMRVFFTGIGGVGSENYTWKRVDGSSVDKSMPNSDWFEHSFDWDIPTYALFMDGKTAYNLRNYNGLQIMRRNALVNYHNSVRDANTAMQNAIDLAATANTNVNADCNTMVANMTNTTNTQTANTALTVACNTANKDSANLTASNSTDFTNQGMRRECSNNNALMASSTTLQNETSIATTGFTGLTNFVNGVAQGVVGGLSMAGAAGGAAAAGATAAAAAAAPAGLIVAGMTLYGAATSAASAVGNYHNALILTQCQANIASNTIDTNSANNAIATSNNQLQVDNANDDRTRQNNNNNNCITSQMANTTACETNNNNNTVATMRANAARTFNTSTANSGYTRQVAVLNAKETLENAQDRAKALYNDSRNNIPMQIGSYSGSYAPDYIETRGIQVKVRTENDSCISQAGAMFARYGYALNEIWNVKQSGLSLMKHFTYWKASDIWVDDIKASNNAVNRVIENIFLKGVTVWKNPDEIGRVDIYAN